MGSQAALGGDMVGIRSFVGGRGGQLEEFGIVEALWMDSWDSENLRQHVDGLHDYDPYQRGFYMLVIYFRGKSFEAFLQKLPANLAALKWQYFAPVGSPIQPSLSEIAGSIVAFFNTNLR